MDSTIKIARISVRSLEDGVFVDYDIPVLTKFKDGIWFAHSPLFKSLGYSTVSEEDAIEDQYKDIEVFLQIHVSNKTLHRALSKLGWSKELDKEEFATIPNIPVTLLGSSSFRKHTFAVA
ncbi:MAG: hypothetical protein IPJ87_03940 [Flavobacteriales bacterium]|nr:hypothetical protein [Flavobacteriales bacterium]MBK8949703.1 hypothetical protein [Flavobacteriales bacterium]MBK9701560.1 hypothetical protein [Flavobacteriales bacterium]